MNKMSQLFVHYLQHQNQHTLLRVWQQLGNINTRTLSTGNYRIICERLGENEFMIVYVGEKTKRVYGVTVRWTIHKRKNQVQTRWSKSKTKTKRTNTKTHIPWWNQRVQELSNFFGTSESDDAIQTLSWVSKIQHIPTTECSIQLENGSCTCRDGKEVTQTTRRLKKIIPEDKLLVCRKVRIRPTEQQKKLFHWWFGITRLAITKHWV